MRPFHKIAKLLPALFIAGIIFYFSSLPGERFPVTRLTYEDKFLHIAIWSLLTFLTYFALGNRRPVWIIAAVCFGYGIFDELHQAMVRAASVNDIYDLVADLIGVALGILIWKAWRNRRDRHKIQPQAIR